MKALVVKSYKDAKTLKIQKQGTIVEVSKERFEKINSTAHGVFLVAAKDEPKKEPATKKPAQTKKK